LAHVLSALKTKTEKSSHYIEARDGATGEQKKLSIEELEKKIAAEEWHKQQEYYMKNPNARKNNFFMKSVGAGLLQREDSLTEGKPRQAMSELERQQKNLHNELTLLK
jgi:hypothetical protein